MFDINFIIYLLHALKSDTELSTYQLFMNYDLIMQKLLIVRKQANDYICVKQFTFIGSCCP